MPAAGPESEPGLPDRLLDSITEAVVSATPRGVITYWNRAAEQLYGWQRAEVLGRNLLEVLVMDALGDAADLFDTVAAGAAWSGDVRITRRDGTSLIVRSQQTPVLGPDGELLGITGTSYDVSLRRLEEAELQRAQAVVAGTYEAVMVISVEGTVLDWNASSERVYGLARAQALGRHIAEISISGQALGLWEDVRDAALATGHAAFGGQVLRADGTAIHVSGGVSVLRNGTGDVRELVAISRDVSETVRLREDLERSHHDLEQAQRLGQAGSWQWEIRNDTITWSDNMYRLNGVEPEEFVGTVASYLDLVHPKDRQQLADFVAAALDGTALPDIDHRIVRPDGQIRWMTSVVEAVLGDDGKALRLLGVALDVTERVALEHELRSQRDALAVHAAVLESSEDAVIVASLEGTITVWNSAATRLYGHPAAEALGQSVSLILDPGRGDVFGEILHALAQGPLRTELVTVCKDGRQLLTSVAVSHVRDAGGPPIGIVGVIRDITEQQRAREREQAQAQQLAHLAFHDPLTGLANRALLNERLAHALVARRRSGAVSVLMLDLDDFKTVNDVSGHAAGDRLLVEVAGRLTACVRAEDTVARLGGDEFAILVESGEAEQVAERVLDELSRPVLVEERLVMPGASIGIAQSSAESTPELIMLHADAAMYAAKAAGKGRALHFAPSMSDGARERAELHEELRQAVDRGQIVVHYQPVIDVQAEAASHMEALVRWQRADAVAPPAVFLRLAEESGLIVGIGLEVLRLTCEQLHAWLAEDERRSVAVNVSAVQLGHPDFAEQVPPLLASYGVRPTQLVLEVTESLFLDPSPALLDQLTSLRTLGVRVSIDDFGTGYSSLGRLQALPVDSLKIDKSFVDLIRTGREDLPILTSMILMAHSLGLDVTAEGVETKQQAERLVALGCDHLQGYFFSRPQPAPAAVGSAAEQAATTFSSVVGGDLSGASVLLIEDDRVTRAIVRMTLATEGFDVEEATTGREGVALAGHLAPVAVIVDLGLPDVDGLAVVRALRAQPELASTAILVLTGAAQRDIRSAAFAAGADDYIVKPLVPQPLAARLRGAIRNASSATA